MDKRTPSLDELLAELVELFVLYVDSTVGLPDMGDKDRPGSLKFSMLEPDVVETEFELQELSEEEVEALMEDDNTEVYPFDDVVLSFFFNSVTNCWSILYGPANNYGFELICRDIYEGVSQAIKCLEQQIAFLLGDVETYVSDIDKELESFLGDVDGD